MNIATTIRNQIQAIDPRALWAWGSKELCATAKGLQFKSSGMVKWKGYVHIELDQGQDLYNVTFFRIRKFQQVIDKKVEGVFAEDLVNIIDGQVG